MRRILLLIGLCLALAVAGGFALLSSDSSPDIKRTVVAYSNIHPADYVGPQKCAECHVPQYESWQQHPHSRMNLNASPETVVGDFNNRRVDYADGYVRFEQVDQQFLMTLYQEETLHRQYRVTRTVGSRFTQMYIGVQTEGPEAAGDPAYSVEGKLPFGYWMKRDTWTPESYFDSDREAEPTDDAERFQLLSQPHETLIWNNTCIYCHNTYPYQHRVFFGEGLGFPVADIVVPNGGATVASWGPTTPEKLVTLGVSCESCHFGGREHAVNNHKTRYVPSSPQLRVVSREVARSPSDPTNPYILNSVCSQCHCAKISCYPNGAAIWNSREALDMTSGGCKTAIKCTDCHDPHLSSRQGGLKSESDIAATCVGCHETFRNPGRLADHTRHPLDADVSCLDCHMPKIVQGLEAVVRTHHIHSPTDERMLRNAGPNACNLCHLDRSIQWTVDELRKGWNRNIDIRFGWDPIYGRKLDVPVGKAWLKHRYPVVPLVAAEAISYSQAARQELPSLLALLKESRTVNRMFGLFAVERVLGRRLTDEEYNPLGTEQERDAQVDALISQVQ